MSTSGYGRVLRLDDDDTLFLPTWTGIPQEGHWTPTADHLVDGVTPFTLPTNQATVQAHPFISVDTLGNYTAKRDCTGDVILSCFFDVSGSTDVYVELYTSTGGLQVRLRVSSATSGDSITLTKRLTLATGDFFWFRTDNVGAPTGNCNIRQETTDVFFRTY